MRTTNPTAPCVFETESLAFAYPCTTCVAAFRTLQSSYQEYALRLQSTLALLPSAQVTPAVATEVQSLLAEAQQEITNVAALLLDRNWLLTALKTHFKNNHRVGYARDSKAIDEVEVSLVAAVAALAGKNAEAVLASLKAKYCDANEGNIIAFNSDIEMDETEGFNRKTINVTKPVVVDTDNDTNQANDAAFAELFPNGIITDMLEFDMDNMDFTVDLPLMPEFAPTEPTPSDPPLPQTINPPDMTLAPAPSAGTSSPLFCSAPNSPSDSGSLFGDSPSRLTAPTLVLPAPQPAKRPHSLLLPPVVPPQPSRIPAPAPAPVLARAQAPASASAYASVSPSADRTTAAGRVRKRQKVSDNNFLANVLAVRERRIEREWEKAQRAARRVNRRR